MPSGASSGSDAGSGGAAGAAGAGCGNQRELGLERFARAPVLPVGEGVLPLGAQWIVRPPERDDVVVDLLLAGNLDEEHAAVAPVADRLDPQARTLLVMGLEI